MYNGSPAAVTGGEHVILMTYLGGGALNVMYGGTIIDGTQITTVSVTATSVQANRITATELLQTEALIVNQAMIANATIGTLKVLDGDISGSTRNSGTVGARLGCAPPRRLTRSRAGGF